MSLREKQTPLLMALQKRTADMTRMLGRFVRSESPTDKKAAVDRFGGMVAAEWRRRGAHVEALPQRACGNHWRVTWPGKTARRRQILVLGHLDTVYAPGTLASMPFRVSRGRAFGPGAFDMKGGLVIALFAAEALLRADQLPRRRIVFLWTSDEETGSATSRAIIEREALRSEAVLVLEPASGPDGRLKTQRKGVGTAELRITGKAAHAGLNPQDGINAVQEMALQIARLGRLQRPQRGITVSPTLAEGGTRSNVIPASARLTVDLRAENLADMRAVERGLRALRPILPGAKLQVRGGFSRPPLERRASAALFARAREIAAAMGIALGEASAGGGSDGNFTAALGVPTLDGLGAVGEGAHSDGENVLIRALPERAALLAGLLASFD
jgi:glutamate carboxypeptidase